MKFSPLGHTTAGGPGDGHVTYDDVVLPGVGLSGESAFIDEWTLGFRELWPDGVYRLTRWDLRTHTRSVLDEQSASTFRAGGGVWAADILPGGVRISSGLTFSGARLCDVSPDDDVVICPDYAAGLGLRVLDSFGFISLELQTGPLGGTATGGPNVRLRPGASYQPGVLLYQAGGVWQIHGVPIVPRAVTVYDAVPVTIDDVIYLVEHTEHQLTVRPCTSTQGWIIANGDAIFGMDAIAGAQLGTIRIGWHTNIGETAGSQMLYTLDVSAPTVDLDPVTPPVTIPTVAPFPHGVIIAPFKDPTHASGCAFSAEELGTKYGATVWDSSDLPVVPASAAQFWITHYLIPGDTLETAVARWARNEASALAQFSSPLSLHAGIVGRIPMFYTQDRWTLQQTLDAAAACCNMRPMDPRVQVTAPFAWDRANGCTAYPELRELLKRVQAATPGDPAFLTPTPIPPIPPTPEEPDMPLPKLGDRGAYRAFGATSTPVNATVVACQDPGFLSLRKEGNGKIVHFSSSTGAEDGDRDEPIGTGEERVVFLTGTLCESRSGDAVNGPIMPFEWYPRA